jgi:general secretion pathway protein G
MVVDGIIRRMRRRSGEAGVTLTELIIVVTILSILATMRRGIDMYKDVADLGGIQTKADSNNYPPDLDTLVNGVDVKDKKMRFLRAIPVDPMTGTAEWGLRSNQDEPDSDSFGGQNVYDVYSKSQGTGLDGTKYSTW